MEYDQKFPGDAAACTQFELEVVGVGQFGDELVSLPPEVMPEIDEIAMLRGVYARGIPKQGDIRAGRWQSWDFGPMPSPH